LTHINERCPKRNTDFKLNNERIRDAVRTGGQAMRLQRLDRPSSTFQRELRLRNMSLVFTLALRNLFQDRLRFIASLMGIVFSVVLVMVQMGLYFGFSGMVTTMIDHTSTDLWIVSSGANYFEDLS